MKVINTANLIAIQDNSILLVQRAHDQEEGGLWSLPGGTQELNEKINETLGREIKEELDVLIDNVSFFRTYITKKPESNLEIHAHYYTGSVANQVITINKSELIEFRWFEITQIPKKLAYSQYEIINDLLLIK